MKQANKEKIQQAFKDLSFIPSLYVVGGAVRDYVMGNPINDIDVCSKWKPEEIIEAVKKHPDYEHRVSYYITGIDHGTITVAVDGRTYEHTTFRKDSNCDGRHAEVIYTNKLEEDAARRDFTMNAMYMDIDMFIIDLYGGQTNIKDGILRAVGNPEDRIKEDYLRIIRAIRFMSRYKMDNDTYLHNAIHKYSHMVKNVSIERIVQEIDKAFKSNGIESFVMNMWAYHIFEHTIPELNDIYLLIQNPEYHPESFVGRHIAEVVDRCEPKYRWHALFHDIGKLYTAEPHKKGDWMTFYNHDIVGAKKVGKICRRLKLSNTLTKEIEMVCMHHMKAYTIKKPSKLRKFAYDIQGYEECIKAVFYADHPDNKWPDLPEVPEIPNGSVIHDATQLPLNSPLIGRAKQYMLRVWINSGETRGPILLKSLQKHLLKFPTLDDMSSGFHVSKRSDERATLDDVALGPVSSSKTHRSSKIR